MTKRLLQRAGFLAVNGSVLISSCTCTALLNTPSNHLALPDSVFDTIHQGKIAVVDNFLPHSQVTQLRSDAQDLYYNEKRFITDAIADYSSSGKNKKSSAPQFDAAKDRSVCPAYIPSKQTLGPFVDPNLGDAQARVDNLMNKQIAQLRHDLSIGLDRPGMQALPDGMNNHEVSYTRFGPGACLKRHTDEHHEELKGVAGWAKPTRRSLSWLIYLNEADWDVVQDGGALRTFPRQSDSASPVGSRQGDLQVGWLTPTLFDPVERPIFLDAQRKGESGNCALYMDNANNAIDELNDDGSRRKYLTKDFRADPYLFLSTGDWIIQHVLMSNTELGSRFHYVEPPKSQLTELWDKALQGKGRAGENVLDVAPTGGTLVMFDSVTLPHQVMATMKRERWAVSGWFHEAQQDIPFQQQQQERNRNAQTLV